MKIHGRKSCKLQRGFTLIEILVGMALTAILITGIVVTIFQVNTGTAQTKNSMWALRQVQTAGYYISQDALQAKHIDLGPEVDNGFPFTLNWIDPPSDNYTVLYEYIPETQTLKRTESINGTVNTVIQIAENINASTSFSTNGSGYYILNVTANVSGYQPASETRTYEIEPRVGDS